MQAINYLSTKSIDCNIFVLEKLVGKFELYKLLDIGLSDIESSKTKSAKEVFSNLKASIKNEDI